VGQQATLTRPEVDSSRRRARSSKRRRRLFATSSSSDALRRSSNPLARLETGNYNGSGLPNLDIDKTTALRSSSTRRGLIPPRRRSHARLRLRSSSAGCIRPRPREPLLSDRWPTFGVPRFQSAYSSVVLASCSRRPTSSSDGTIHYARVIRWLTPPHVSDSIRSDGRLARPAGKSNTLVVDTTNSRPIPPSGASRKICTVERFTRVSGQPAALRLHMSDPGTWTDQCTARIPLQADNTIRCSNSLHKGTTAVRDSLLPRKQESADGLVSRRQAGKSAIRDQFRYSLPRTPCGLTGWRDLGSSFDAPDMSYPPCRVSGVRPRSPARCSSSRG